MNTAFAPPNRVQTLSPVSVGSGSEWSGMNNYNGNNTRLEGNYNGPVGFARTDSATPPDPMMMNGPPSRPFGPPGMESSQRRRPSDAGSLPSSRAASVANSRSSDGTISDQHSRRYKRMEIELQQHYTVLKHFLKGGAPQPPRPNKARDKLLRLSPVQFHELSTDVFDELQRRQAATPLPGRAPRGDNVPPFLQPRREFHEKRNQARQKLSSLQTSRFRDLSTDVFCELERRFPVFGSSDGRRRDSAKSVSSRGGRPPPPQTHTSNDSIASSKGFPPRSGSMPGGGVPQFDNPPIPTGSQGGEFGRPVPKQFQSSTITPNKSIMVEDDEDDDDEDMTTQSRDGRSSDAFGLESAITSPASRREPPPIRAPSYDLKIMQDRLSTLESTLNSKESHIERLEAELEQKVQEAQRLQRSLEAEVQRLQSEHATRERELETKFSTVQRSSNDGEVWKSRHDELYHDHQTLQERYTEQQKITEEVSKQGEVFLREMRAMAEEGEGVSMEREEKLHLEVSRLENEVAEWKGRYAKAKTQSKNTRVTSLAIQQPNVTRSTQSDIFRRPDGLIKDIHVTRFQIAIDELLHAARGEDPTAVMDYMKSVVIAVRSIALDVDDAQQVSKDADGESKRNKLKSRTAATANNLITAGKSFAAAGGLSPVSLLDAAASHLCAAVVDLVQIVKICPTTADDSDYENNEIREVPQGTPDPVNGAGYFNMSQRLRSGSQAGSEYSALSSPQPDGSGLSAATGDQLATPRGNDGMNGSTGLGIQSGMDLKEDDTELQELKIYLENQTDLLVQTIQSLVGSIRNEDSMSLVHEHMSGILDIVENVLSAAEGAMDDPSWYQDILRERAAPVVQLLTISKDKLMAAGNDPKAHVDGPSSRTFTQRLPPLAFQIARETKELVARLESVEAGHQTGEHEDFS